MSVKQLWAPWRMEFISENKKGSSGCVFCSLVQQNDDRTNLILHRTERVFVILNKYPYNNGHLMVVPYKHQADFTKLADEDLLEMSRVLKQSVRVLQEVYQPEGFNIGMNLGVSGGAGIKDHLHTHVVPRWLGDTNFMPVLGETKAMPQHLMTCYDQMLEHFRRV